MYGIYNTISLKLYILNKTLFRYQVEEEGLKITFWDAIKFKIYWKLGACLPFCCFSARTRRLAPLFFTAQEILFKNLDIQNYVKNANDIRIVKKILFNKE